MIDAIKLAIAAAWEILFAKDTGVVLMFVKLLSDNPIFLLPIGFYLLFVGAKTCRRLIRGE